MRPLLDEASRLAEIDYDAADEATRAALKVHNA